MHNIKYVSRVTGLSPHTIRAWEKRYSALSPDRTDTNRRLYTGEDIDKLLLLTRGIQEGHSIGRIAHLTREELQGLVNPNFPNRETSRPPNGTLEPSDTTVQALLKQCLSAIHMMDSIALSETLTRASALLGTPQLMESLLSVLLYEIGERWREGSVWIAQEHMASAVIRTFLGRTLANFQPVAEAPCLIVATPVGQFHELGAMMAGVTAALEGWRILYLGSNLPAVEIAGAVHRSGSKAVALSIIYPSDDLRLPEELEALRLYVGKEVDIIVGGRDSVAYRVAVQKIGATLISDMQELRNALKQTSQEENVTKPR